jgi:hypothetical protein
MQYLLNEAEFQELQKRAKSRDDLGFTLGELQTFCSMVADKLPIHHSWNPDEKSPWGCILTSKNEYCDACPCKIICPNKFKHWSQ